MTELPENPRAASVLTRASSLAVPPSAAGVVLDSDASPGAVSWGAIIAGAAAAAALSLILLVLGVGLGLSSISPWSEQGVQAGTLGVAGIVWLAFMQLAAAGLGGYVAGRLRVRWARTHADEVYFRDTAHGFLAWSVATLFTAALLTSTIAGVLGMGAQAVATTAGGAVQAATTAGVAMSANGAGTPGAQPGRSPVDPTAYFVDMLMRPATSEPPTAGTAGTGTPPAPNGAEAGRILAHAMAEGSLPPDDAHYLGQLVAQRTGLSPADAEKRVTDTFASMQAKAKQVAQSAQEAADKARKASAYAALWLFVSLLIGAFAASLCATWGGRQRDRF